MGECLFGFYCYIIKNAEVQCYRSLDIISILKINIGKYRCNKNVLKI